MRRREISVGALEELSTYLDSLPAPPMVEERRAELEFRLESDSQIHNLHELQRLQRASDVAAVASRFESEHEKRVVAELALKDIRDRAWLVITGVLVLLIAAGIVWLLPNVHKVIP